MWGGILYFCAVLVGTCKVHGCNLPKSKILCRPPQGAAILLCEDLHQEHCGTVGCLVLIQPRAGRVQAQVTQKSDNSTESRRLLNYYMQKGFKVQVVGERGRMWAQISLCCNSCSTGRLKWIPFALFPKITLIVLVKIPTFAPQDFVRIYLLTLQVTLNAKQSYREEIPNVDLVVKFTKIGYYDLSIALTYQELTLHCVYVYVCMENWDSWEEKSHIKCENSKIISFRNTVQII